MSDHIAGLINIAANAIIYNLYDSPPKTVTQADWSSATNHATAVVEELERRGLLAPPPAQPVETWRPDREAVARVIDPEAWAFAARHADTPNMAAEIKFTTRFSLAKADAILALGPPVPVQSET